MIENKFTPKIRYVDSQLPHSVGGDENISPLREFFSYSDTDYEYLIYRTRGTDSNSLSNRTKHVDRYHREESSEDNNFNLGGDDDYQTFFDDENVLFDFPDEIDATFKPGFFLTEISEFVNEFVYDRFFYTNTHANFALYYFLSFYFYFSEYVWPISCLYFPFLEYISLIFAFGWDGFLEHHLFACFFTLYLPFVVYLFFHWYFSTTRYFFAYFNFFRFALLFFTVFFFCVFMPIQGLFFLFFLPALVFSFFFAFFFPFLNSHFDDVPPFDFYADYTRFLLPPPVKGKVLSLPLYAYRYPWRFAGNIRGSHLHSRFTRFPFLRISSISAHNKRVQSVFSYRFSNRLYPHTVLPHNFPYLQPENNSGFLFQHFPLGFGYSAESHVMLEGFNKESNIEFDNESGLRPDNYTIDFITNELGVSNVRFFLGESYHLPVHYSANFNSATDFINLFSPQAFSAVAQSTFGPYYQLSIWLTLIKPTKQLSLISTVFDNVSFIPDTVISGNNIFHVRPIQIGFTSNFYNNLTRKNFIAQFYQASADIFYSIIRYFCLRFLGFYRYSFSEANTIFTVCQDFCYIFSSFYPRCRSFKELFRFMIFINKNHKSKRLSASAIAELFPILIYISNLLFRLELLYSGFIFKRFFVRHLKYVRLCRLKIWRLIRDISFNRLNLKFIYEVLA